MMMTPTMELNFELNDTLTAIFEKLSNELSVAETPMQTEHSVAKARDTVIRMVELYISQSRMVRSSWLEQLMQTDADESTN